MARSRIWRQPIGWSGYPSASAIGSGMAMTSGVSMKGVGSAGAMGSSPASLRRWFRIVPHELAAGDQITGRGPSAASSHPSVRAVAAPPEALERTST
ncbi:MAG: hypothetical protein V9E94_08070 [Microthrixaceae bacterium]